MGLLQDVRAVQIMHEKTNEKLQYRENNELLARIRFDTGGLEFEKALTREQSSRVCEWYLDIQGRL